MSTEVKRHGLSELYPCRSVGIGGVAADIVFVHGLFGHPESTWTFQSSLSSRDDGSGDRLRAHQRFLASLPRFGRSKKPRGGGLDGPPDVSPPPSGSSSCHDSQSNNAGASGDIFWPRDLLPKAIPQIRVFTYGYDVDIVNAFSTAGKASVYQHAKTLLNDLADVRTSKEENERPIIFVVHSLGGIVVKDALSQSRNERTHLRDILPATAGVCFLGTPHRGSGTASLGKVASEFSKIFFKHPNIQVLDTLEVNSSELERIGVQFSQILVDRRIRVHSFYEEYPTKGVMVVQNFSYSIGDAFETTSGIPANHSNMTKFSKVTDTGFRRIVAVLQRWLHLACGTDGYIQNVPSLGFIEAETSSMEIEQCLNSLNVLATRSRIAQVEKTFGSTYEWIFQDRVDFKEWLSSQTKNGIYWIQGKPGSGKSTLMKFVLQHPQTLNYLRQCEKVRWICSGFFFHDRGSQVQKSVTGLLCAILYDLLLREDRLRPLVLPVYRETEAARSRNTTGSFGLKWTSEELCEALLAVLQQTSVKLNLCLFIDALDEHDGDHKMLLKVIRSITNPELPGAVLLKLCLASRPENVFKNEFQVCPGFAIHEHTLGDIQHYTAQRIAKELPHHLQPGGVDGLQELSDEVTGKARGVFIWVKLVVNELLEHLCNGSSISELREILSAIPTELEGLYERALTRLENQLNRWGAIKFRRESYVMFQIALCMRSPMSLPYFINATSLLTTGTPVAFGRDNFRRAVATPEMLFRLNSRCGGLLEPVTGPLYDSSNNRETVQFIHQTAKEFMVKKVKKLGSIEDELGVAIENGDLLLMRYCILVVGRNMDIRIPDFGFHAYFAEFRLHKSNAQELDLLLQEGSTEPLQHLENFCSYLTFGKSFGRLRIETRNPQVWLLLIAIYGHLFLYFEEKLVESIWSKQEYLKLLLAGAVQAIVNQKNSYIDARFIKVLLSKGVHPDTTFEKKTPLQVLLTQCRWDFLYELFNVISLLLEYGADANQLVSAELGPPLHSIISFGSVESEVNDDYSELVTDSWPFESQLFSMELFKCKAAKALLQHGASVNFHNNLYRSPLHCAVEKKQKSLACELLLHGALPLDFEDRSLWTNFTLTEAEEWKEIFHEYYTPLDTESSALQPHSSFPNIQTSRSSGATRFISSLFKP